MPLPSQLTYGKVEGRFLLALGDGNDQDDQPDAQPASGTIIFTPTVNMVQFFGFNEPVSITPEEIVCTLDDEGYLIDPQGARGVWLVATSSEQSTPAEWHYKVSITFTGKRAMKTFSMSVPGDKVTNLAAVMPPSIPISLAPSLLAGILEARDEIANLASGYMDHGPIEGALTLDAGVGTHVMDVEGPTVLGISPGQNGQLLTIRVLSGGDSVAWSGIDFEAGEPTGDKLTVTALRERDAWVSPLASGGEPAAPDTTPPSPITGLTAAGGEGSIALSWTPSVDNESTRITYRYRAWLTVSGASGEWQDTSLTSVSITELPAGAYTVEVYAFTTGGATSVRTATATTQAPAGWTLVASDDFTAADGTPLDGRMTPTGARHWIKGAAWEGHAASYRDVLIQSNRAVSLNSSSQTYHHLDLSGIDAGASGIRVSFDYTLDAGTQGSSGPLQIFGAATGGRWRAYLTPASMGPSGAGSYQFAVNELVKEPAPLSGAAVLTVLGAELTLTVNGTTIVSATLAQPTLLTELTIDNGLGGTASSHTIDNFTVEAYK